MFQILTVASAVHHQVQLDVVVARREAKAANGEIGAAQDGLLHAGIGNVIHLAVEQLRLPDGPNIDFLANPFRAVTGNALLLKPVCQFQPFVFNFEALLVGLCRVERCDETRLPKKEIQMVNLVKVFAKRVVSVDREISGDDGQA